MRRFGLVVSTVCLLAPLGLELVGVLPSSYVFEGGRMITLPQMTELPRLPTFAFIALANMGSALLPALVIVAAPAAACVAGASAAAGADAGDPALTRPGAARNRARSISNK